MVSATMSTRSFPIATIYTVRRLHIRRPRPLIFSLGRVRCSCGPSHNPLWGGGDMQLTGAGYLHRRAALDIWPARRPIIRDVRAVPPTWKAAYWKARRTVSQWAVFARRRSDRNWPGQQLTFGNSCPSLVAQGQLCLVLRFLTINIPMTSCRLLYHPGPWATKQFKVRLTIDPFNLSNRTSSSYKLIIDLVVIITFVTASPDILHRQTFFYGVTYLITSC